MTISIRLDDKTISILEKTADLLHASRSKIIKQSVIDYCSKVLNEQHKYPYELVKDLIGKEGSGKGNLSIKGEEILRKTFRRKV